MIRTFTNLMKSTPKYAFQARANERMSGLARACFSAYYGSGKTYLSLAWLTSLRATGKACWPCLVLCPKTLVGQWHDQIKQHSNFTSIMINGKTAEARIQQMLTEPTAHIYLLHYDAYRSPKINKLLSVFGWQTLIVDECTAFKETRTARFKTMYKWIQNIPFRAILSGRLITEKPEDIFGQFLLLDDGAAFGRSFWKFRMNYMVPGPPWKPYDWTLRPGAANAIAAAMLPKCAIITRDELEAELPPQEHQIVEFDWPEDIYEQYKLLKKEFTLELPDGGNFETQWAITKATKMHQLCQGFTYAEDRTQPAHLFHTTKLDWLEENLPFILERGPILIWSHFNHMVKAIEQMCLEKLKLRTGSICGLNEEAVNEENKRCFQANKLDILCLSQRMAARGLDLWQAPTAIFVSRDFSHELNENAAKRNCRSGSEVHDKILYIDLVMKKSMDGVVIESLEHKRQLSDLIMDHLRSG